jgi:hypothetical protein
VLGLLPTSAYWAKMLSHRLFSNLVDKMNLPIFIENTLCIGGDALRQDNIYNNFCLINFSTILVKTISHPYLSLNVFFAWKMMTMLIQPITTGAWIPVHQASNFSWHVRDALTHWFFLWKREEHTTLLQPYHPDLNCNKDFVLICSKQIVTKM